MNIILYLKESPLGLKYLGKCVNRDVYTYMGSGKRWKNHILKHNLTYKDIETTVLLETKDVDELKKVGEYYSNLWDIVKSNDFANLRPENGDGGWGHIKGVPKTKEWKELMSKRERTPEERKRMSESKKGIVFSDETKMKMSKARSCQKDSPERNKKEQNQYLKLKKENH